MTDKRILRAQLLAARDATSRAPIPVPRAFFDCLTAGLIVASYRPLGSEADPAPLAETALAAACTLALPHVVDRATPIRFLRWHADDALVGGPFGLQQPAADRPEVAPDIILTPLLGFDRRGNRIGQGAGHYDRAFVAYPNAWRIGIALAVQEMPAFIPDPWDVPLHAIATDSEWIVPS